MKTFLSVIISALLVAGCNSISQPKPVLQDSVRHDLPVTGQLSAKDYEYYHQLAAHYFDSALLTRNFNGSVLVAKNGVIVYEACQGFRDLRQKEDSLTADTPMHIASASKTFTGMAVLQLVQQGKLHLDDTLSTFFPGFPYPGVTVKTLLNHRSGLPNYVHYLESLGWDKSKPVTNADVLNSLFTLKPAKEAEPDRRFSYSNTNYLLLAMIIEKVTGKPYPQYMQEQLFSPLHMEHTFVATDADSARITPSFDGWGRYWQPDFLDKTYGDKNIYTTARDLLKWDIAISNGQIVDQALLDAAYTPYSNERPSIHNYGLAWRLLTLPNGKKVIYHNGRWHGTNSAFARLLDEKATIIVIGNRYNNNIYRAARGAYDLFGNYLQRSSNEEDDENVAQKKTTHRSSHHATTARKSAPRPRKAKK